MKLQLSTLRWQQKYMTAPPITIYWQFLKQVLHCIIPLFHEFPVWNCNDVLLLLCPVWLYHLMSQINMSVHNVFLIYYQKLATIYQYQSIEIIGIGVKQRLYDIQFVTIKICYCNDIDFIHKVLHVCLKIWTYYDTAAEDTICTWSVSELMTHFVVISNLYICVW